MEVYGYDLEVVVPGKCHGSVGKHQVSRDHDWQ